MDLFPSASQRARVRLNPLLLSGDVPEARSASGTLELTGAVAVSPHPVE
ncbi:MAG: hypothetical protein E3K37_06000 [Candidatus Kuenenia sp.]|nr:hypothetical protein [Candidatus Kuenenia hertensis]